MNTASTSSNSSAAGRGAAIGRKAFAILILAFIVRVVWLNTPFLEPFNSIARQSICAQVARNFYIRDANMLHPQIDVNGNGPSLYNAEMPWYTWIMSLGYRAVDGPEPWAARSVTVIFSMLFLVCLYKLARSEFGERSAQWTLAIAAFSPLGVALSRSIQPDMTMIALLTAALWFARRYANGDGERWSWISAGCLFLAAATKVFALLALPAALLLLTPSSGGPVWRRPKSYVYSFIALLALAWYAYMWLEGRRTPLGYEPYTYIHGDASAGSVLMRFLSPEQAGLVFKVLTLHHLTVGGSVLLVFGLTGWAWKRLGTRAWLVVWGLGLAAYSAAFWPYLVKHGYYQLPWLPWIALVAGRGAGRIYSRALLAAAALLLLLHAVHYYPKIYFVAEEARNVERIGETADRLLPKDAIVLGSYGSSPAQVYFTNRRGWGLPLAWPEPKVIAAIEAYAVRGAGYLVTSQKELLLSRPALSAHLKANHRKIYEGDEGIIFQLMPGSVDLRGAAAGSGLGSGLEKGGGD